MHTYVNNNTSNIIKLFALLAILVVGSPVCLGRQLSTMIQFVFELQRLLLLYRIILD